jgi:hypothetical protein
VILAARSFLGFWDSVSIQVFSMADLRRLHQEWLDYVKPDGLVVTSSALAAATVGLAPDAR